MGILDQLQQVDVGQDPTSQGIAALPASTPATDNTTFVPPTTDSSGSTDASDQPVLGGLLGNVSQGQVASAVSTASQDPDASKGLLGALAGKLQTIGSSIANLSPAASQGLLATGLGILANNDGQHNLSQIVGAGGITGLNAYSDAKQQQQQQAYQQQQQALAQQQATEKARNDHINNVVALKNSGINQQNADTKARELLNPNFVPVVTQNPDGTTSTLFVNPKNPTAVGATYAKDNPYAGPLPDAPQATVNAAQTAAATAVNQYQSTQQLASQVANADWSKIGAKADDALTFFTGNKDAAQQLRGQLAQYSNMSILSELPPGSASDKDIELVHNGLPNDGSSQQTWQAYLSAVANVQKAQAITAQSKADFVSQNRGSLGPLTRAATIAGQQYPAGTTFSQVIGQTNPTQAARGQSSQNNAASQTNAAAPQYSSLLAEAQRRGLVK